VGAREFEPPISVFFKEVPKENNRPTVEKLPNGQKIAQSGHPALGQSMCPISTLQ
jgi:hypothetical protein